MKNIFDSETFYLPNTKIDYEKWSIISCDQHTSSLDYWKNVKNIVNNSPSSLNLILPEAYIHSNVPYSIKDIYKYMDNYLSDGTLVKTVDNGLILVERETSTGKRIGVVGIIDLEEYSYDDNNHLIVATEDYVKERLKMRVEIRKDAKLELSHAIIFVDDKNNLIEKVYKKCQNYKPLYDFNLMENGGHIRGYLIDNEEKNMLLNSINKRDNDTEPIMMIGDGNHSLAAAKVTWENYKLSNPLYDPNHPLRYAMVEVEALNSETIKFYPIHRFVFDVPFFKLCDDFKQYLSNKGQNCVGNHIITFKSKDEIKCFSFSSSIDSIKYLQDFLDNYIIKNNYKVDYLHDEEEINYMISKNLGSGILLESINKDELFDWVKMNGHLPKKSFSIGTSNEKRYYLESRIIK